MSAFNLKDFQKDLMESLLKGSNSGEKHLLSEGGVTCKERISVYQSSYRTRLKEVIDRDHKILGLYLGDDLFDQMVEAYIDLYPSQFKSLRHFGDHLPELLFNVDPFSEYPVLAKIAEFERLLIDVFDSKDEELLRYESLQAIRMELWPQARFEFASSLRIYFTEYNSVEIWGELKNGNIPPDVEKTDLRCWLLWRNHSSISEYQFIEKPQRELLEALMNGLTMREASTFLIPYFGEDSGTWLITYLKNWLQSGLITNIIV